MPHKHHKLAEIHHHAGSNSGTSVKLHHCHFVDVCPTSCLHYHHCSAHRNVAVLCILHGHTTLQPSISPVPGQPLTYSALQAMKLKVASGQVITATLLEFEPQMTTQDARVTAMHQYNPIYRFMCNKNGTMVHANKMAWEAYSTGKHIIMPLQAKSLDYDSFVAQLLCVCAQAQKQHLLSWTSLLVANIQVSVKAVWVYCMQLFADRVVHYVCLTYVNVGILLSMPGNKQNITGTDATCCTYDLKNALHPIAGCNADCHADSSGAWHGHAAVVYL